MSASDGLVNYESTADISATLDGEQDTQLEALVSLARLPSGALPDHVSIITVR